MVKAHFTEWFVLNAKTQNYCGFRYQGNESSHLHFRTRTRNDPAVVFGAAVETVADALIHATVWCLLGTRSGHVHFMLKGRVDEVLISRNGRFEEILFLWRPHATPKTNVSQRIALCTVTLPRGTRGQIGSDWLTSEKWFKNSTWLPKGPSRLICMLSARK